MDDVLERALGRLRSLQTERLRHLLASASTDAGFYRRRLESAGLDPGATGLDDLSRLPLTGKADLVADQEAHPPWGSHLSRSPEAYVRLHKTSGTTGRPLLWVDTADSWSWFRGCWRRILELSGVTAEDRVFVAFSFGPFIGFWGAFEAAQDLGALALTGGALSSDERLDAILDHEATVLVSTPTYALRLAELAAERGIDLAGGPVRLGIHAGEPGARVPNVRRRLEAAWGMACIDHAGATEVGAWGVTPTGEEEMAILEEDFLPEVVDTDSGDPAPPDAEGCRRGELVLTNLGRLGSPVIRYRTGDLVEMLPATDPARPWRRLRGGVLGR
ncbi:MAG: AMP-binding protein, partial [Thermoanaerobaculia bacterium]|nr:AMP-binding protein [Thermoanaerobaculia bacterium]